MEPLRDQDPVHCRNCHAELHGPYCAICGQKHEPNILSFGALIAETLDNVFSLDNKLLHTVRLLITQPGRLTNEYMEGHRVRYTSPVRLYLVVSAVYFLIVLMVLTQTPVITQDERVAKILDLMPKLMFFMVPVLALYLKVFFRERYYFEHLIFALHIHAFTFLLFIVRSLIPIALISEAPENFTVEVIIAGILDILIQLGALVYLIMAIRNVYAERLGRSIGKGIAIGMLYTITLAGLVWAGVVLFLEY